MQLKIGDVDSAGDSLLYENTQHRLQPQII